VSIVECPAQQIKCHFRDKSFHAINFPGTDKIFNKMPQWSTATSTGTDEITH